MKLVLKVLAAGITVAILLAGCASTPKTDENKAPTEETAVTETVKEDKKSEKKAEKKPEPKKEEPKDPPDVAFAKKLREKLSANDIQGALALFESIPESIAGEKDMIFLHASLLISAGDLEKAGEIGKQLEEAYPDDLEILEMNALIAKSSGNNSTYKSYSNKILALDPENPAMNIQKGQEYALAKKWKQARNSYKKALSSEPDNEDALFGCGLMSYYLMEDSTADEYFQAILDKNPDNSMALAYKGKLAAESENFKSAIKYIEKAIENDASNYDFHMDYGTYLHQLNYDDEAIEQWQIARDLDPDYFLAYAYLAGISDEKNNYDMALENYRKVIETNPDYYYAYESAGILEWHAENWAEARKDFHKAFVTGGSTNWSYALMVAATYMKEGNTFKAKEYLNPVLKKMPKDTNEYLMVKFYVDNYSKNAMNTLVMKIQKEESTTKRGKLYFYFGLYNELYGSTAVAVDYYGRVASMQAPMFFEYRMAEWGMGLEL
ncbi:MAG: tetratricopeptide repeat protein [Treponema sp.]|nr:tetratricopeptide repeat protein [Treponema sp.]